MFVLLTNRVRSAHRGSAGGGCAPLHPHPL